MVFIEKIYQDRTSLLDFYVFVLWYYFYNTIYLGYE